MGIRATNLSSTRRPNRDEYYLGLAVAVASRAECRGLKVGAVIVKDNRVLSTGYNGTPEGWGNCSEGGACPRCDNRDAFGSGNGYDKCICVHAEMNAIAAAARYGMAIGGGTVYETNEPCLTCAKELVQAGIKGAYFIEEAPDFVDDNPEVMKDLQETRTRFHGQLRSRRIPIGDVVEGLEQTIDHYRRSTPGRVDQPKTSQETETASIRTRPAGRPDSART